ncbi:hypothetical protein [Cellulomonas massiliensis]|uniref:hypothetical protein n=1 Tax=Cellulomonas massiliensis TaxID=1465811 RepID=UPI000311C050|nr:hypothetical protein [Cellulomonas massiliensis]
MGSKATTWVGGAVFVALVLAVLAWFVQIGPTLDQASVAAKAADDAEAHNVVLTRQLTELKKQSLKLDVFKADLRDLQRQVPADAQLSQFLRQVDGFAEDADVFVRAVNASPATAVVPAELPEAPADAPAGDASEPSPSPSPSAEGATPTAPKSTDPADAQIPGFVAVPVDITVHGSFEQVKSFVKLVQNGPRPFLLIGMKAEGLLPTTQTGEGERPIKEGDLEMTVSGYVYTYVDTTAADDEDEAPEPTVPRWNGNGTPFAG